MTTKILIVNLGPSKVKVIAHDPNSYMKYSEQELGPSQFAAELYLHSGQRVTVVEEPVAQSTQDKQGRIDSTTYSNEHNQGTIDSTAYSNEHNRGGNMG